MERKFYHVRLKLIFDTTTRQFRLIRNEETHSKNYCIKQLSSKKLNKITVTKEAELSLDHQYKCWHRDCKRWVDKICLQHPMVFVKEKRPNDDVYSARDTVPEFLYLAASTIRNAGLGVFTRLPLPPGVAFGPYAGFITYSRHDTAYAWDQYRKDVDICCVDAKSELFSNWMRYVNCARWEEEQNMLGCFFYGKTYYHTYKFVPADSELLIWYGEAYAQIRLGIKIDYTTGYFDQGLAPSKAN